MTGTSALIYFCCSVFAIPELSNSVVPEPNITTLFMPETSIASDHCSRPLKVGDPLFGVLVAGHIRRVAACWRAFGNSGGATLTRGLTSRREGNGA